MSLRTRTPIIGYFETIGKTLANRRNLSSQLNDFCDLPTRELEATTGRPHTAWTKNIHDDLFSLDLGIYVARDLAQNRPLLRLMSLHSATHS